MQLRHVEYFVATVDAGSVSAASRALHVTQPALSRQLRQLERELGVALFDREGGRLALSRTGQELLPAARRLLTAAEDVRTSALFHQHGEVQRLTIAAPAVTLTDVVAPFVASMRPDEPVVDVRSADGESPEQMLRAGADLVIASRRPGGPYESRLLAVLPVWAYVPGSHPWAGRGGVPLLDLVEQTLLVPPASFAAREAFDAAVLSAGGACDDVVEAANGTIAQALAAAGRGVAVVSDDPRYDLRPLAVDVGGANVLRLRLLASWDGRSVARTTMAGLADRLQRFIEERYGCPSGAPPRAVARGAVDVRAAGC